MKLNNVHNHVADAAQEEANQIVQQIKTLATITRDPPNYIVAEVSSEINRSAAAECEEFEAINKKYAQKSKCWTSHTIE